MDKIDEMMAKYRDRFGEAFPAKFTGMSDEEVSDTIQECLDTDTPYDMDYEDGVDY